MEVKQVLLFSVLALMVFAANLYYFATVLQPTIEGPIPYNQLGHVDIMHQSVVDRAKVKNIYDLVIAERPEGVYEAGVFNRTEARKLFALVLYDSLLISPYQTSYHTIEQQA